MGSDTDIEKRDPWRSFGLAVIGLVAVGGLLGAGFVLVGSNEASQAPLVPASTVPVASTTSTTDAPPAESTTTMPVPSTTEVPFTREPIHDFIENWRANDPSLAAAVYTGPIPPETREELRNLKYGTIDLLSLAQVNCEGIAEDGLRFNELVWPAGEYGVLARKLTDDEANRFMQDLLTFECPENA